jgi:hypothetical protein
LFVAGQQLGFDLLPRHFYSEIPDLRALRHTKSWRRAYTMRGVSGAALQSQFAWVKEVMQSRSPARDDAEIYARACADNGEPGYGEIEAIFLHRFIQKFQPQQIIQIGCGVSTAVCLRSASEFGYRPRVRCIEPYPTTYLERLSRQGEIQLLRQKLQEIDPVVVTELGENDFFFVDSTHTLGPAGEASRIILEFLPSLKRGVLIHFHDIVFPYDYMPDILDKALVFSHESTVLHAFLAYNRDFSVLASLAMLHHQCTREFTSLFPDYRPAQHQDGLEIRPGHFPSSVFFRRTGVST